ncbi:autotransporter outer membrane beta-barrel domain-containing protein [Selenomonadales bacterium OttesenSCG-928-I06]|nr:autotransporter outer membrane beta-barrel domain-containing protein [Selenomonadales bacterium OttesenSCG-928-I06]
MNLGSIKKYSKKICLNLLLMSLLCPQAILAAESTVSSITVNTNNTIGQTIDGGNTLNVTNDITVSSAFGQGVLLNGASILNIGGNIVVSGDHSTPSSQYYQTIGANIINNGKVTVENISVAGKRNIGVKMADGTLIVNEGISVSGPQNGNAPYLKGIEISAGTAKINGDINVDGGSYSKGIDILGGSLEVKGDINVAGKGFNSGIYFTGGTLDFEGDILGETSSNTGIDGSFATNGTINVKGDIDVKNGAYGIAIKVGNEFNFTGDITTTSTDAMNNGIGISLLNNNDIATEDTVANINAGTVTIKGVNGYGIVTRTNKANIKGNIIVDSNSYAYGLAVFQGAKFTEYEGEITVKGVLSSGIQVYSVNSTTNVNGDINVTGDRSSGIDISGSGGKTPTETTNTLTITGDITNSGAGSQGVRIGGAAKAIINGDINVAGGLYNNSSNSFGILLTDLTSIGEVNGNINVTGSEGLGVYITGGNFTSNGNINATSFEAYGVYIASGGSAARPAAVTANLKNVTASGEGSTGVEMFTTNAYGNINTTITGQTTVSGKDAVGIYTYKRTAGADGTVTANVLGNVSVTGDGGTGLFALDTTTINMANSTLTVNSATDDTTIGFLVGRGGTIKLDNVTASATGQAQLISAIAVNAGTVEAKSSSLSGNVNHGGQKDQNNVSAGTLTVVLTDNSSLTGAVNVGDVSTDADKKIDVKLNNTTDTWNITGDSTTNGTLINNGTVNFSSLTPFKTTTVKEYTAGTNSSMYMNVDIDAEKGDHFIIDGKATGSTNLYVQSTTDSLGLKNRMDKALILANDWVANSSDAEFILANSEGYVDAGGYKYILNSGLTNDGTGDDMEWFLVNNGLAPSGQTLALGSVISPEIWYLETDTLFNRLNNYKDKDYNGGFWMAAASKKIEHSNSSSFGHFDQTLYTMSLGFDKKKQRTNGNWFTGIMAGYGEDDRNTINGIGNNDMKSFQASIYTINQRDNGFYAGGLIKYNRYRSDISARINDSYERIGGHLNQDGLGTSFIMGKRFERKNGWYVEPVAQLSYLKIYSDSYTSSSDSNIKVHDGDSLRARGGVSYGRKRTFNSGNELDMYLEASLVHEFDGETDVVIDGLKLKSDFGGTWGMYGIGTNYKLKNGNYLSARLYYADGNNRREPWAANVSISFRL